MRPTAEQAAVIEARLANTGHLIVEAGAGSGKTSVLNMAAEATGSGQRGLYAAFNKVTQLEAAAKFPTSVQCRTMHSLAFAKFGHQHKAQMALPSQTATDVATVMGLFDTALAARKSNEPEVFLQREQLARLAKETVARFCRSADFDFLPHHVEPWPAADRDQLVELVLPIARRMWADLESTSGRIRFAHDHYRKMWQLSQPKLRFDYIMLDEAQDTAPVVQDVVRRQEHAQQIIVGDSCQQLYAWAGAVDALANWGEDCARLFLTKSWRFGPVIADEANKWLAQLGSPLHLTGNDAKASVLAEIDAPDAILCRTNLGAFGQVLDQLAAGRRVALVGGGAEIASMARAARDLMSGRRTRHPELSAFESWDAVCVYAGEESADGSIKALVRLVDEYGPDAVDQTMKRLSAERDADVTVSTGHKAKGREWGKVRIASDFPVSEEGEAIRQSDANLAYVAVTRATAELERGPLSFIDTYRG